MRAPGSIALLIGCLMPALANARESARTINCASNVRTIMQAWIMYANENRGLLPASGDGQTWPGAYTNLVYYQASTGSADIEFQHGVIMRYLSRESETPRRAIMLCPDAQSPPSPNVSYVFSADLKPETGPRRITQIQHSSEKIPLVEQETPDEDGNFDPDDDDDIGCVHHFRKGSGDRLTGMGNYGFTDGHVATLTP